MRGKLWSVLPLGAALVCLGAVLICVGCNSGSGSTQFRYVQASTGAPLPFDVEIDGKTVLTGIGFGQTPSYQKVSSGSRKVAIFLTGTTTNPVFSGTISFSGSTTLITENPFSSIALAPYTDDTTTIPSSGDFRIRIIHASPTAGNVDVYLVSPPQSIQGLSPQFTNLSFSTSGTGSATTYTSLAAGNYEIVMTQAGTQNPIAGLDQQYTFTAGQVRTILMLDGVQGGGPWTQLQLNDLN